MERLNSLLASEEDLPFATTVNEQSVYNALLELVANGQVIHSVSDRVRQWMRFNQSLNIYEDSEYQLWVCQLYSKIELLLRSELSNDFHELTSSNVAQDQWHYEESTGETRCE